MKLTLADIPKYGDGENILANGLTLRVATSHDQDHGAPWEECDGHGPVSDWTRRAKHAGEVVLATDRHMRRFYDFAGAIALAERDRWGISDEARATLRAGLGREPTAGEVRVAAVNADFDFLREWCADLWQYIVLTVSLHDKEGREIARDCIGGVENRGNYWRELALENAQTLVDAHEKETVERAHWEARDTVTA